MRAAQLLLGHKKIESTVRYPGIEVDDGGHREVYGPTRGIFSCFLDARTDTDEMNRAALSDDRPLERWGALHAGRSALGLAASLIFLWAQRRSCC